MAIDFAGWAQAAIASSVAAGSVFFFAGGQKADLANTKQEVVALQTQQQADKAAAAADHDTVTALKSQVSDIKDDVSEIKQDVKTLLRK